jgi:signal transduction histidine kinase/DNA-binding response OmpR family regulator
MTHFVRNDRPMQETSQTASILLVDDRPDKLLALEAILEGLHQNLVKVRSGDEALRQLLLQDFAVILLDVNMPGLDGFETAALIRKRKRSETTPIIFISAINDTDTHVSRGYSLGAVDYILSPVVPEILRAKVAVFVDLYLKSEQVKRQAEEHAQLLQEQAARARAEEEKERMTFLAEASNVLASSLDYEQTFASLARLIVPRLAEFCLIDRLDDDGHLHQVAVAHRDPHQEALLRQIRYPEASENSHGALRVFQTGVPFVRNEVDDSVLNDLGPEADRALIRLLKPAAFAAVPLTARGRVIGSITMVRTDPHDEFDDDDLWLADELAHRSALALDNVELYRRANLAREEAETANRAKDRFLAMLSHELRTPLTPVITHLFSLSADERMPKELHHSLEVIRRNVELEARLIDDLLDLTRVGTGKFHLESTVVDVHELLENALEICQPDIAAKGLQLRLDLSAGKTHVNADPARLQQVFWNIVKNAVKFTSKGSIHVSTATDAGGSVTITIRDTGIGIEPALLGRVFHPFEQAERGVQGGLGLGLAITKALVELHSGHIDVDSRGHGHGTTVTVSLPLAHEVPVPAPERRPAAAEQGKALRVLLLEDHPDTNEALTMLLELRGYSVTSALNVSSALEIAARQDFDLLLSDLGLPDGSPGEVMKMVAARNGTIGIALSGLGMEKDFERSRALGFRHHLVKPVDVGRLEEVLQECGKSAGKPEAAAV